jgi:hypothetical protein
MVTIQLMLELVVNGDTIIIGVSLNTMMIPPYGGIDKPVVLFNLEEWMIGDYAVIGNVHERENNMLIDATIKDNTLPVQFSIIDIFWQLYHEIILRLQITTIVWK